MSTVIKCAQLQSGKQESPISRVELKAGSTIFSADSSNPTGFSILYAECPWGTQAIANDLLAKYDGYQYRGATALDALIPPSLPLAEPVSVNNVYFGAYDIFINAGPLLAADVSAPSNNV